MYGVPISASKFRQFEHICGLQSQESKDNIMCVFVDNIAIVEEMIDYCKTSSITGNFQFNIMIKVDAGCRRAGIDITKNASDESQEMLINTVKLITNNSKYLNLHGMYSYSGQTYTDKGAQFIYDSFNNEKNLVIECKNKIENENISVNIVSIGSTPACRFNLLNDNVNWDGITEVHPGNYVFYDNDQVSMGCNSEDNVACSVMTRIIGVYKDRNELLIDVGNLGLSLDKNETTLEYGKIIGYPNLRIQKLSQEVGLIVSNDGSPMDFNDLKHGKCLRILPHHSCLTACSFPFYYLVDDQGMVIDVYNKVAGFS